jgi:hypothetical protein
VTPRLPEVLVTPLAAVSRVIKQTKRNEERMNHPTRTTAPRRLTAILALSLGLAIAPALNNASTQTPTGPDSAPTAQPLPRAAAEAGLSPADWHAIRTGIADHRHRISADGEALTGVNPGQRWQLRFDDQGFLVTPAGADWQWGLTLTGWGRGAPAPLAATASPSVDANRVSYRHGAQLTEWLINDARGLEHGFTIAARPAGDAGELVLRLAVRGALEPRARADGRGLDFVAADGRTRLDYTGLVVADADGVALPARLAVADDGVWYRIDDTGARYPIVIDPVASAVAQEAYLKASNTGADDRFGWAVAVSGDTAVVGAYREDSSAVGIDGDGTDNSAAYAGAAYVFVRDPASSTWSQQAYLKASNTGGSDRFGYAVAVSGDTAVVGAYYESSSAVGIDGDGANNSADLSGAAYVFVRDPASGTWSQQAYLKASNTGAGDHFGRAVAVSGDTAVVGANWEDSSAVGIDGDGTDNSAVGAGAAYVFVRDPASGLWSQQAYLKASNTGAGDDFGRAVAVSGDTAVVGAYLEDSSAVGIDGDGSDNTAGYAGAAYVFVRDSASGIWSQQAYLKASNTGTTDRFGYAVAVSGDTTVVGAYLEDSSAVGIDGDGTNNSAQEAGAAYVFTGLPTTDEETETVVTATNPGETLTADPALPTRFVYTARAQAGGLISGFESGTDQIDLTAVLAEQGWTGTDPSADGTLRLLDRRGRCYLLIDPDGSTGSQRAFTQTVIDAVPCTDLDPATDLIPAAP